MEAATAAVRPPSSLWTNVRAFLGRWGLIIVLAAMPVYYGIQDLVNDGNLTRLGNNLVAGLSNGSIWAIVALGYTLVYGIIELINFAHGDLFMIGSFVSYGLFGSLGIGLATATLGIVGGLLATLILAMIVCGLLIGAIMSGGLHVCCHVLQFRYLTVLDCGIHRVCSETHLAVEAGTLFDG